MPNTSHSAPAQDSAAAARPLAHGDCCHHDHHDHHDHDHDHQAMAQAQHTPAPARGSSWPWAQAAANTAFCLLGCSLGDVAVVVASRQWWTSAGMATVMASATIAGLASSLALETLWLAARGQRLARALRMAVGMSLLSMVAMETAMNLVDLGLTGGNRMHLPWLSYAGVLAAGEVAGFLLPWPFNAWRLSRGQACH